ncbi:hypothetical protein ACEQ8H_004435 [Pleosporales sp. CAS-2024a]
MRRSTFPPRSARPAAAMGAPEPPTRKVFHCIVDDTALIAGVKKSTRDGVRKWIAQGAIRLYVPLHTLAQLHRLKTGPDRLHADAREAVRWLDDITSAAGDVADRVRIEGADETFATWAEVEHFLLPKTLLSMQDTDSDDGDDGDDEHLASSFNALDVSDETSQSSTHSCDARKKLDSPMSSPSKPVRRAHDADAHVRIQHSADRIPVSLHPLFSHVLWRIHMDDNPDAALDSFILLTNDPTKLAIAQKFGIRAKRLEQLRDAVAREDREYRNHLAMHQLETQAPATPTPTTTPKAAERPKSSYVSQIKPLEDSDDEAAVGFKAPKGPAAAAATNSHRVFDPNDFARTTQHHSPRGGRGGHGATRGRGAPPPFRGRGNFAPRGAYIAPGPAFRAPSAPHHDPNQPLDPNSFTRPALRANPVRGGQGRKLWEPN